MSLLSRFCVMCGAKHEYTLVCPKFCGACGTSLDGKASTAEKKVIVVDVEEAEPAKPLTHRDRMKQRMAEKRQKIESMAETGYEGEEDDAEDDEFIPKPGKLEISVVSKKKETLADLAVGAKVDREARRESGPLTFKNQKQFERDFKKLAGKTRE